MRKVFSKLMRWSVYLAIFGVAMVALDYWRAPTNVNLGNSMPLQAHAQSDLQVLMQSRDDQVRVIYFWGSWCGICRYTSPAVQSLHEDGVAVIAVATASGSDEDIAAYLKQNDWDFPVWNDNNGVFMREWQVKVVPTIVLLKNGEAVHSTTGLASYWGLRARIAWAKWFS